MPITVSSPYPTFQASSKSTPNRAISQQTSLESSPLFAGKAKKNIKGVKNEIEQEAAKDGPNRILTWEYIKYFLHELGFTKQGKKGNQYSGPNGMHAHLERNPSSPRIGHVVLAQKHETIIMPISKA